jgi:preprotein translocase subunit SecA
MINWVVKKVLGSKNEREVKKLWPLVAKINAIEAEYQKLSDEQLRAKTDEFKKRIGDGATLDDILPEAFAAVKNACRRLLGKTWTVRGHPYTWDMVPFDVQLIGAIVLHQGKIAEMATGEGKTLVATMPLYLNALTGKNVQLVTVNDYLAARDSEWMGEIYRFLGLSVGCIQHDQPPPVRKQQYACDITYGTNSEFGFDYLRDNGMATSVETQVQRGHYYAIVDEVDSILIDEARTPLIISGPATVDTHKYDKFKPQVAELVRAQTLLCNRLVTDAKKLLDSNGEKEGKDEFDREVQAGRMLYQVKQGMPKNKQLLRLMEDPEIRRILDRTELDLLADKGKEQMHQLHEELFFVIDEKGHQADLTEKGRKFLSPNDPEAFVIPDLVTAMHEVDSDETLDDAARAKKRQQVQQEIEERSEKIHNISQLLRAYCLFEKDVDYVVQDNKVIIVDEFTGRLMPGRRWSDGLHQAVEAKEGVAIERETQTLATITIQNYFRLYEKLAGMTGTAETEAAEFHDIYKLDVVVIPTNKPVRRVDLNDVVYKTRREKYNAIVKDIAERHAKGQPLLVGTVSVESSEVLSRMLKRQGVPHSVLNAKYHQQEAEIVARAGQRGAVTIATNMAGRGTDIKLGAGVTEVGGLHVIGSERHEARRIDRQLRGRCARQGDPGSSQFFVSLEDDLMRLFGSERIAKIMDKIGMKEGEELQHPLLNRSIETAQKRVEQHNYSIRKRTLEYDDVMNKQREVVYGFRNEILRSENPRELIFDIIDQVVEDRVEHFLPTDKMPEEWDIKGLVHWVNVAFPIGLRVEDIQKLERDKVAEFILQRLNRAYEAKAAYEDPQALKTIERYVMLSALDRLWQENLYNMDSLRTGIGLRAYGQKDPLVEYKAEAFAMFENMMSAVKLEIANNLFRRASSLQAFEKFLAALPQQLIAPELNVATGFGSAPAAATAKSSTRGGGEMVEEAAAKIAPVRRDAPKVGRNEPCPCGSGKKFKHCCGKNA